MSYYIILMSCCVIALCAIAYYCTVFYARSISYHIIHTAVCAIISLCDNGQVIHSYHSIVPNKAKKDKTISDKI